MQPSLRNDVSMVLAVSLIFAGFAVMAWDGFGSDERNPVFYPATGVTVAALMLSRRGLWPWILAAVVTVEVVVVIAHGNPWWAAAVVAAANALEALIGASLVLAFCGGRPDLRKRRQYAAFILGACLIAPAASALIGGTVISVLRGLPWLEAVGTWWAGDALGVLVAAAPILLWSVQSEVVRRRPWETAGLLAITSLLSVIAFWTDFPPTIFVLPVLVWVAFRLDVLGAALGGAVAACLANFMSTCGLGPFADIDVAPGGRMVLTEIYIAVIQHTRRQVRFVEPHGPHRDLHRRDRRGDHVDRTGGRSEGQRR